MKTFFTLSLFLALFLTGRASKAQDFVYEPKNPSFGGGNTFNYTWLLSSAQAQNSIPDPASTSAGTPTDPLANFANNLNQQVLSQLSNRLIASQFGSGAIRPGSYTVGNYQIQVTPGANGISVQVTDSSTGNQTTITIPNTP
ncbi:curli production assembly/transport component CsgF [Hymenobacter artigasi]|uniref:Curli production assembly/transport component CsgF n=1 Tax=Hymenobacter artigasi TaxID=2719616 RepID=A0ABX1HFQ8_9BACT|nr:curli production assembly/transport component CsgF [Hymenobacter artigasi]NKI87881.1 curli production assembly/transport component CsgF [Hymenobacter artigasi]